MSALGKVDPWIREMGLFIATERILVDRVDNRDGSFSKDASKIINLVRVEVDDYVQADGEKFDEEEWQSRVSTIFFPPTREFWRLAWAIARSLAKGKNFYLYLPVSDKGICITPVSLTVLS